MYIRDITRINYTESCFGSVSNTELYVPQGSKYIYQEYYPWRKFKNITEFDDGHVGEPINPLEMMIIVDGLRYKITDDDNAQVARQDKSLSGDIIIPETVMYEGKSYTVNSIVYPTNTVTYGGHTSISAEGGAFQGSSITSVTIPQTITSLPSCAFINCSSLQKVVLPETLTSIGFGCFAYCSSLSDIVLPANVSNVSEWALGGCSSLKTINIPEKLTTLSQAVFYHSGLEEITIPATVNRMVEGCLSTSSLQKVFMYIEDVTKISYTESCFGSVGNTYLYVPVGSKKIYKEYYPWMNFKEIIESQDITASIEVSKFIQEFSNILAKTIETVSVDDKESIENALSAYSTLSEMAQAQLQVEKGLLDALKQKVDEMIALATAKDNAKQELSAYKDENDYREAQQVELANAIAAGNEAIDAATTIDGVNTALANAKSTIDAIKTDAQLTEEEVAAEVGKFKSDYAGILAKTTETVSVEDKESIENALSAYSTLSEMAQAQLQVEKGLLDALKQKVDEMIALATAKDNAKQELSAYKDENDYREAQQVELANAIAAGNEAIDAATTIDGVNTALANAKSTIDAIKTDAQLTEEEVAAEVGKFKSDYADILAKTTETVSVDDKEAIENALSAYAILSEMAQAQLWAEKELLDTLKQKVDEIISGIDLVTIDNAKVNIYTLSGQKVQTVQKGRVYIVDGKKTLIK